MKPPHRSLGFVILEEEVSQALLFFPLRVSDDYGDSTHEASSYTSLGFVRLEEEVSQALPSSLRVSDDYGDSTHEASSYTSLGLERLEEEVYQALLFLNKQMKESSHPRVSSLKACNLESMSMI
ncbi:Hypothetical protein FKW44_015068 [Caligus rogercresseyi]|uniref:Uncharacterized protein n=1 Tax=Caligus rogercresseyi TaxID=217165 RepID=A0A7T8GZT2_CALRO|nr:Hypothetical protein FKW44_015068 [Caligus rogercresseyi]